MINMQVIPQNHLAMKGQPLWACLQSVFLADHIYVSPFLAAGILTFVRVVLFAQLSETAHSLQKLWAKLN